MAILHADPTNTQSRTTLPPVQCTPWCERGNGHPDETHRADQVCMSRSERTPVGFGGANCETYVIGTQNGEPMVVLGVDDGDRYVELRLTVEQAERLLGRAARTVALAEQAVRA